MPLGRSRSTMTCGSTTNKKLPIKVSPVELAGVESLGLEFAKTKTAHCAPARSHMGEVYGQFSNLGSF